MRRSLAGASRRVFVDTSAYIALADKNDANHLAATTIYPRLTAERQYYLFTTNFILSETYAWVLTRLSREVAIAVLEGVIQSPATTIERVSAKDEARAWHIITTYTDKNFSLVDAMSFAVMERLHIQDAFAFDRHFTQYGLTVLQP